MRRLIFLLLAGIACIGQASITRGLLGCRATDFASSDETVVVPVEYLECDGGAWIYTGIMCSSYLTVEGKLWTYKRPGNSADKLQFGVFGYNSATFITHDWVGFKGTANRWVNSLLNTTNTALRFSVDFGNRIITRNGTVIYNGSTTPLTPYTTTVNAKLLKGYPNESSLVGRFYYFRIWEEEELVRDYVPVKVIDAKGNEEGAMLDLVSGELFFSIGTSPFACGPDKQED